MDYEDYQEQSYNDNNYSQNKHSALSNAFKVGAGIGAMALAFRYRRPLIQAGRFAAHEASRGLSMGVQGVKTLSDTIGLGEHIERTGSFFKALDSALDNKGIVYQLSHPGRFQHRFDEALGDSLKATERIKQTTLGGQETAIERDMFNYLNRRKSDQQIYENALGFDRLINDLGKKAPAQMQQGLEGMLVNVKNQDFFRRPSQEKVAGFVHMYTDTTQDSAYRLNFKNDEEKQNFMDTMLDSLNKFADRRSIGMSDHKFIHKGMKQIRDRQYDDMKSRHQATNSAFDQFMHTFDYHQATVEDLIQHKNGNLLSENGDSIYRGISNGKVVRANMGRKIDRMAQMDPEILHLIADKHIYINSSGDILDMRRQAITAKKFLHGFRDNVQIPFLGFNPLDLMHFSTMDAIENAPASYLLKRGTIDVSLAGKAQTVAHPLGHNADAAVGPLARDYMFVGGKVFNIATGDQVADNVFLASSQFGIIPRAMAGMGNLHSQDYRNMGFLQRLFDVNKTEEQSVASKIFSFVGKFFDENWERNYGAALYSGKFEDVYKNLYTDLNIHVEGLSDDVLRTIAPRIKEAYGKYGFDIDQLKTPEDIMGALGKVNQGISDRQLYAHDGVTQQIQNAWHRYSDNPTEFLKRRRVMTDKRPIVWESLNVLNESESQTVSALDDVKRLLEQHASRQLEYAHSGTDKLTVAELVKQAISSGRLDKEELGKVRNLETLTEMQKWWKDVYHGTPDEKQGALEDFASQALDMDSNFGKALKLTVNDQNRWWNIGPGQQPPHPFGYTGYQTVQKGRGIKWWINNVNEQIQQGKSPLEANLNSAKSVFGQPFAGRNNIQDVTSATLPFYYFAERLDAAASQVPLLGLSQRNKGSMQSIIFNQFFRKLVLPYVAYKQLQWLNDETGDVTTNTAADTYVNMREDMSRFKEALGINALGRSWSQVFAGADQIGQLPTSKAFNFLTLGAFSDFRSPEDVQWDYAHGDTPIRHGRFWGMGSNTPWEGGRVDRFVPNWYRRLKSNYQYTDTMYGSKDEYWANSWMPTLTHPFAPLRHFVLDPYHWENKHKDDRPYPVTGGFPELQQLPIVGPIVDNTLGRILKPRRERGDLAQQSRDFIKGQNEYIKQQYEQADQAQIQYLPAGGYNIMAGDQSGAGDDSSIGTDGGLEGGAVEPLQTGNGSVSGTVGSSNGGKQIPMIGEHGGSQGLSIFGWRPFARKSDGRLSGTDQAKSVLTQLNATATNAPDNGEGVALGAGGTPAGSISYLGEMQDVTAPRGLMDTQKYDTLSGLTHDIVYQTSEIGGIYGFLAKTVGQFNEARGGSPLESSSNMNSYSKAWWNLELGGLGGQASEIGRRYVPKDHTRNYYNPIRNTMPDWLPGFDYFTNFQYGDPYCVSPETSIEIENGHYKRADEVNVGDIIKTHKGNLKKVEALRKRLVKENERVYKISVSTLPAFPFEVSEGHPILSVKNPLERKNYGELKNFKKYLQCNQIINALWDGPLTKKEINEFTGIAFSTITDCVHKMVKEDRVIDPGRRQKVILLKHNYYDINLIKRGISWVKAKDLNIGDYVAYPLPKQIETPCVLDMKDYLDEDEFIIGDNEVYYGTGSSDFIEIIRFFEINGIPKCKNKERKEILEGHSWDEHIYESAQSSYRKGLYKRYMFPRFLKLDENLATLFGYWLAEGSVNNGVVSLVFHSKEKKYREKVQESIHKIIGRTFNEYPCRDENAVKMIIGCNPLAVLLEKLFNKGSHNKNIPSWFIDLPNRVLISLLRSYLYGDGSAFEGNHRAMVSLKTVSKPLSYMVREILLKLGIVSSISASKPLITRMKDGKIISSGISYSVNANGAMGIKLSDLIGYGLIFIPKESPKNTYYIDNQYLYLRVNKKETLSCKEVPEVIGFQVGEDDSFCVVGVATHNTKIGDGAMRLPGKAYEALHQLHPDQFFPGSDYGAFDRMRILADVAPYSSEYRMYKAIVSQMNGQGMLSDEEVKEYKQTREEVAAKKQKFHFYDRRFRDSDTMRQTVHVTDVIDANTFLTKEYPNHPIKLAGVHIKTTDQNSIDFMSQYIKRGATLRVELDEDPLNTVRDDTMQTMRAVVYPTSFGFSGQNLNYAVAHRQGGENVSIKDGGRATDTKALFSSDQVSVGKAWEFLTHDLFPNLPVVGPIADKFLQVRNPVEEYERLEVYGKEWRPWTQPIKGWVEPMIDTIASKNPVLATLQGAGIGWLFGRGTRGKFYGKYIGGAIGALVSTIRVGMETKNTLLDYNPYSNKWIPKRRREQRDIDVYFDRLKYVKYHGLYEKARQEAIQNGEQDPEVLLNGTNQRGAKNKQARKRLQAMKESIYVQNKLDGGQEKDRIKSINDQLNTIGQDKSVAPLGQYTTLALKYRAEYESTMYGADPNGDMKKIFRALPKIDRDFFPQFMKASPRDREKILSLVPEDERRFYEAKWGMDVEKPEDLHEYFKTHTLPGKNWAGWKADVDLNDIKLKIVKNEGQELTEFGFWPDDEARASLSHVSVPKMHDTSLANRIDTGKLQQILEGEGLENVQVSMQIKHKQPDNKINMAFNMMNDRSNDIVSNINQNLQSLFS